MFAVSDAAMQKSLKNLQNDPRFILFRMFIDLIINIDSS